MKIRKMFDVFFGATIFTLIPFECGMLFIKSDSIFINCFLIIVLGTSILAHAILLLCIHE